MPDAETAGLSIHVQHHLGAAHIPLVRYARDLKGVADVRTQSEHFDPLLLEACRAIYQELQVIYSYPYGGTAHGDCAGNQEWEG